MTDDRERLAELLRDFWGEIGEERSITDFYENSDFLLARGVMLESASPRTCGSCGEIAVHRDIWSCAKCGLQQSEGASDPQEEPLTDAEYTAGAEALIRMGLGMFSTGEPVPAIHLRASAAMVWRSIETIRRGAAKNGRLVKRGLRVPSPDRGTT